MFMWRPEDKLAVIPYAGHLFWGGRKKSRLLYLCTCMIHGVCMEITRQVLVGSVLNMYMNAEHQFSVGV